MNLCYKNHFFFKIGKSKYFIYAIYMKYTCKRRTIKKTKKTTKTKKTRTKYSMKGGIKNRQIMDLVKSDDTIPELKAYLYSIVPTKIQAIRRQYMETNSLTKEQKQTLAQWISQDVPREQLATIAELLRMQAQTKTNIRTRQFNNAAMEQEMLNSLLEEDNKEDEDIEQEILDSLLEEGEEQEEQEQEEQEGKGKGKIRKGKRKIRKGGRMDLHPLPIPSGFDRQPRMQHVVRKNRLKELRRQLENQGVVPAVIERHITYEDARNNELYNEISNNTDALRAEFIRPFIPPSVDILVFEEIFDWIAGISDFHDIHTPLWSETLHDESLWEDITEEDRVGELSAANPRLINIIHALRQIRENTFDLELLERMEEEREQANPAKRTRTSGGKTKRQYKR